MTLSELITLVDGIKPNSFTNAHKTMWVNECEGIVQKDIWLIADCYTHLYSSTQTGNVTFGGSTMVFESKPNVRVGGYLTITDSTSNNVKVKIVGVSADGLTLTFAEEFTSEETECTATYDGSGVTLLVDPPFDKIYWTYLSAMIDFANGEYNKYNNTMQLFNSHLGEYTRWFARNYDPANGECEKNLYYVSAYGIAVKNGFVGTEAEWLLTLSGEDGTSEHIHIKYAATEPAADGDMTDTPSAWIGVYSGVSATAPTNYTDYSWQYMKGADGTDGDSAHVYIKYSATEPDGDDDLTDTPSDWMGIYSGTAATAPTAYTSYAWYNIKGTDGSTGFSIDGLTAEITLADDDYVPFQDTSETAPRKSLWSNIKSVLKTYFDTLYVAASHSHAASSVTAGTLAGKVLADATAQATLGDTQVRNIYAGTTDMTAGSTSLTTGSIYCYYEA